MSNLPPTPWKIKDNGSAFGVYDARGRGIAFVYYKRVEALRAEYLSWEDAREMAIQIARLSKASTTEAYPVAAP